MDFDELMQAASDYIDNADLAETESASLAQLIYAVKMLAEAVYAQRNEIGEREHGVRRL